MDPRIACTNDAKDPENYILIHIMRGDFDDFTMMTGDRSRNEMSLCPYETQMTPTIPSQNIEVRRLVRWISSTFDPDIRRS